MPEETLHQPTSLEEIEPKMKIKGTVTRTELYGAFVNLGLEREGLIHISRLSSQRVKKVTDVVNEGDEVEVWVTNVDPEQGRIGLTLIEPPDVDWSELTEGKICTGKVVRLERYGAFVDIGAERPGLLHVREMGQYVRNPADVIKDGEKVEVKIIKIDRRKRQIDLSMQLETTDYLAEENEENEESPLLSAMEIAFREAQATREDTRRDRRKPKRKKKQDSLEDIYRRTLEG